MLMGDCSVPLPQGVVRVDAGPEFGPVCACVAPVFGTGFFAFGGGVALRGAAAC
jgi:hypothetical protein